MGGNDLNYYSSPRLRHPEKGVPLGVEGEYDVARLITENSRKVAGKGNEAAGCERRPRG